MAAVRLGCELSGAALRNYRIVLNAAQVTAFFTKCPPWLTAPQQQDEYDMRLRECLPSSVVCSI